MNVKWKLSKISILLAISLSTVAAATHHNAPEKQVKDVQITKPFSVMQIDAEHGEAILSTKDQNLIFVYFKASTLNSGLSIENVTEIIVMNKNGDELKSKIDRDDVIEIVNELEGAKTLYEAAKPRGDRS